MKHISRNIDYVTKDGWVSLIKAVSILMVGLVAVIYVMVTIL